MGIEPIDSDLARITRNPITQPLSVADRVRFELTEPCGSAVFKTAGIIHLAQRSVYLVRVEGLEPPRLPART